MANRVQISNQAMDAAVVQLFASGVGSDASCPTVRTVANVLRARYGTAGTTRRICESIRRVKQSTTIINNTSTDLEAEWRARAIELADELARVRTAHYSEVETLREQLAVWQQRAVRAEERETANQDFWAEKVYELRQQLKLVDVRRPLGVEPDKYLAVYRELKAAQLEILALREQMAKMIR